MNDRKTRVIEAEIVEDGVSSSIPNATSSQEHGNGDASSSEASEEHQSKQKSRSSIAKWRIAIGFLLALVADAVLFFVEVPGVSQAIDLAVAGLLFAILGWQPLLLPALIAEATPGIGIFPFWTLVVASIGLFGTIRKL